MVVYIHGGWSMEDALAAPPVVAHLTKVSLVSLCPSGMPDDESGSLGSDGGVTHLVSVTHMLG